MFNEVDVLFAIVLFGAVQNNPTCALVIPMPLLETGENAEVTGEVTGLFTTVESFVTSESDICELLFRYRRPNGELIRERLSPYDCGVGKEFTGGYAVEYTDLSMESVLVHNGNLEKLSVIDCAAVE